MISDPTPATISIIITLSWSVRSVKPNEYCPAESHVQDVVSCTRAFAFSPSIVTKTTIAAAKETIVETVETYPAPRREIRVPASASAIVAASGLARQIQAAQFKFDYSSPEGPELVHVELEVPAAHRHDQPEADDDLGGGDGHDGDCEHLPVLVT